MITREEIVNRMLHENEDKFFMADKNFEKNFGHMVPSNLFFNIDETSKIIEKDLSPRPFAHEVDLRSGDTMIKSQDNGRCTAFSGVACIENMLSRKLGKKNVNLSESHAWSFYQQYSCDAFLKAIADKRNRIADEEYWPQYKNPTENVNLAGHATINKYKYLDNDVTKMMEALTAGNVVYLGMKVPSDMLKGKVSISPTSKMESGGHALAIVGYFQDDKIPGEVIAILKNSWGKDNGDNGYQYLPIAHFATRNDCYLVMWEIESVSSSKDNGDITPPPVTKVCTKWKRVWYAPWKKECKEYKIV